MAENSKIEWCDHTWNPWIGCTKVSPACDHCYAEALMDTRYGKVTWGPGEDRLRTSQANWNLPLRWDRAAKAAGRIDRVFCLSLGDIWDKEVDPLWRWQSFNVMERTPNLLYLLLSKRIGNAERMCDPGGGNPCLPPNAALGATLVNQEEWDRDLPKLKRAGEILGARFTFASVEPMLGPIDTRGVLPDWVIVGGESGQHARPMHPDWARSMRDQCGAASVPFFFKQWGEWSHDMPRALAGVERCALRPDMVSYFQHGPTTLLNSDLPALYRVGKKTAGRLLDGRTHDAMPEVRP